MYRDPIAHHYWHSCLLKAHATCPTNVNHYFTLKITGMQQYLYMWEKEGIPIVIYMRLGSN